MPVVLHLHSNQTMELIKNGDLKVELTDDQAIDVTAQIGQLLKSKVHEHPTQVYKVRKKYRFRRVSSINGSPTMSSRIYNKVEGMNSGETFHYSDLLKEFGIPDSNRSSAFGAISKLKQTKKIKKISKGTYQVV